jgi:hypothetical protein
MRTMLNLANLLLMVPTCRLLILLMRERNASCVCYRQHVCILYYFLMFVNVILGAPSVAGVGFMGAGK